MGLLSRDPAMPSEVRDEIALLATEYYSLREADNDRLRRYAEYDLEFEAPRKVDIFGQVADFTDYGQRRSVSSPARHNIPIPLGTAMTIKHSHRLFGDLPDAIVDRRQETPFERYRSDTIEKIVWAMVRASGDKTAFKDAAWDGSRLGASCFDLYWDIDKQLPTFCRIDPSEIVCVKGGRDVHDFHRVYRSWKVRLSTLLAEYRDRDYQGIPVNELLSGLSQSEVTLVQMTDREKTMRFVLDGSPNAQDAKKIPVYEKQHGLGFVPYVVIPNIGPYGDIWGWGDYELVRGLVHYIPTLFSREADIIRAVAGGAYQEDGTGQSPAKIQDVIRKGGVLPTKRGSKVAPIEPPAVPDFAPLHGDRAVEFLKMVGFAPDAAWGDGSAGSGTDRGLQLAPLLELTAMKQSNWSQGLQRMFGYALQMLEKNAGPGHSTYYSGARHAGSRRMPFVLGPFGADVEPMQADPNTLQPTAAPTLGPEYAQEDLDLVELPRSPKELLQGDYTVRFEWNNRIDPDDPAYAASELNKFAQGVQSLRTTLERLGHNNPEDEMKLLEQEAEKYPWVRDGVLKMIEMQLNADQSGQGGGNMSQTPAPGVDPTTRSTDTDRLTSSLKGGIGTPYGAA